MKLKTLESAVLSGKKILYRAPYDIPVEIIGGKTELKDDLRIKATLPTLLYLLEKKCKIIILTYVGRPDGKKVDTLRTAPHAQKLAELLHHPVLHLDDCIGENVQTKISEMKEGEIIMLENVRFYEEEMRDDDEFSKKLCEGKDLIVFDGFPQAHRMHSSTTGIERHLPAVAGLYLEHEVKMLTSLKENPQRPFTVIIGGAKISDKIEAVNNLAHLSDNVLLGGAVGNVFLKSEGKFIGVSFTPDVFVDEKKRANKDWVLYSDKILESHAEKIICPTDLVISDGANTKIIDISKENVPEGWAALDLGPQTLEKYEKVIRNSATIFLAGPLGKFEDEKFSYGTRAILQAIKNSPAVTIIAGGDTIDAAIKFGDLEKYSHVSLAGGATLEFLAGRELPALLPLLEE